MSDKRYILYLNDKIYGTGSLQYVRELINEWVDREFYNSGRAKFEIVERRELND